MFSNICFHISAERRIVPYDVFGTVLPSSWWHQFFWAVLDILIKSTVNWVNCLKKKSISLYRDDGLSTFRNYNSHQSNKIRKDLTKLFKKYKLNLDIKCNLKTVDYLDISCNFNTGIYKPFNKPKNKPLYINATSNYPPSVLKQIAKSVSKRMTANTCNEDIFCKSAPFHNSILQDCGFNENIKYYPEELVPSRKRKNHSRNIIWYNPPFSRNVKPNVGKHFFKFLKKRWGKNHKYHKNKNRWSVAIKISSWDLRNEV